MRGLSKVAEDQKIEVTREDLAQAASREAMMRRVDPTKFIKELSQDRTRLAKLREDILYDKAITLMAKKRIKEKICDIEENTH